MVKKVPPVGRAVRARRVAPLMFMALLTLTQGAASRSDEVGSGELSLRGVTTFAGTVAQEAEFHALFVGNTNDFTGTLHAERVTARLFSWWVAQVAIEPNGKDPARVVLTRDETWYNWTNVTLSFSPSGNAPPQESKFFAIYPGAHAIKTQAPRATIVANDSPHVGPDWYPIEDEPDPLTPRVSVISRGPQLVTTTLGDATVEGTVTSKLRGILLQGRAHEGPIHVDVYSDSSPNGTASYALRWLYMEAQGAVVSWRTDHPIVFSAPATTVSVVGSASFTQPHGLLRSATRILHAEGSSASLTGDFTTRLTSASGDAAMARLDGRWGATSLREDIVPLSVRVTQPENAPWLMGAVALTGAVLGSGAVLVARWRRRVVTAKRLALVMPQLGAADFHQALLLASLNEHRESAYFLVKALGANPHYAMLVDDHASLDKAKQDPRVREAMRDAYQKSNML